MKKNLTLKSLGWKILPLLFFYRLVQSFAQQTFILTGAVADSASGDLLPGIPAVQAGTGNGIAKQPICVYI